MTVARVGIVSVWHETNEYSPRLANLAQWEEYELLNNVALVPAHSGTRSVIGGFLDALGRDAVPIFAAGAWPSGITPANVAIEILERLSEQLEQAGPLDAIALNLHGAMAAEGIADVEVEIVRRIRAVYGDILISVVMDLHGNPSVELVGSVDTLVAYQTYPHVDMWECGRDAAGLVRRMLNGERLATSVVKLPLLTCPLAQGTEDGPIGDVLRWVVAEGERRGMLRCSVMAGFPYQDVERAGMTVLVVAHEEDARAAEQLVTEAARLLTVAHSAGEFDIIRPNPATAVTEAIESTAHPVVLVDLADNVGAGSAGDGTGILAELLRQGATGAVVVIADSEAARIAQNAGPGAEIKLMIGGKSDHLHGDSIAVRGTVRSISDGKYTSRGSWGTGLSFEMGVTAVLEIDGNLIVVTERAVPPFHGEQLTSQGIDPAQMRIIVAKGAVAWRAAFGDVARKVIEVDAPGSCPLDPWTLPRMTVPVTVFPGITPRIKISLESMS